MAHIIVTDGCTGNDTYYVDNIGDIVTEYVNQGTDRVFSAVSLTLAPVSRS